jgi:hypothetical protein
MYERITIMFDPGAGFHWRNRMQTVIANAGHGCRVNASMLKRSAQIRNCAHRRKNHFDGRSAQGGRRRGGVLGTFDIERNLAPIPSATSACRLREAVLPTGRSECDIRGS